MALEYGILKRKDLILSSEGLSIIDLFQQTYSASNEFSYRVYTMEEAYIARPDLVSLAVYGTDNFADIICKLNGISNPAELNEGMSLIVPIFDDLTKFEYNEPNLTPGGQTNSNGGTSFNKGKTQQSPNIQVEPNFKYDPINGILMI